MEVLMYSGFEELKNKNGVFAFLEMETCFTCNEYLKELKSYNTGMWTIIVIDKEVRKEFEKENLTIPLTRIYKDNKIVHEIGGILYSTQINKIFNKISLLFSENNKNQKILDLSKIKVEKAKTKIQEVQYFRVDEILNVEILGKEIIARKGDYVVLFPDSHIEVFKEKEFERFFE